MPFGSQPSTYGGPHAYGVSPAAERIGPAVHGRRHLIPRRRLLQPTPPIPQIQPPPAGLSHQHAALQMPQPGGNPQAGQVKSKILRLRLFFCKYATI